MIILKSKYVLSLIMNVSKSLIIRDANKKSNYVKSQVGRMLVGVVIATII